MNHQRETICQKEMFHESCLPVNKHMSQVCFVFFAFADGTKSRQVTSHSPSEAFG